MKPLTIIRHWLVVCSTTLLILLIAGCGYQQPKSQLQSMIERGKLRVGTVFGSTSYYIDRSGSAGFEYELAQAFADYLDLELEIVPNYFVSELFPMLDNNQVDLLAGGLSITDHRRKKYRFSPAYYQLSQKLVFKQGNKRPRTFSDIKGTLMVTAQSSQAEMLSKLQQQHPDLQWQQTDNADPDELLEQIVNGQIDYTIADSTNLAVNRRLYPNLSVGFTVAKDQDVGWIITKQNDDSLYSLMIEFFGYMHQSGKLQTLNDKYFGHVEKFNYVDTKMFIAATETKLPKYKDMFKKYADGLDWRLLAALSYQESHWNPRAKSPTGVRGLMMLTLPTAKQMGVTSRLDAEQNIRGGSKYLNRLIKRIPERIQMPDRLWFAIASYNIGWGHVEDARILTQRFGADPDKWLDVKKRLPLLRQRKYYKQTKYGYARGNEPVQYVANIRRYYHSLVWLDQKQQADAKAENYREMLVEDEMPQPLEQQNLPPASPETTDQQKNHDKNTQEDN